uniref:Ribosomal protein L16 n=1 Tax=Bangia fuscopurpurea TaxID=101920 RepID=A0A0E3JLM3_BANFU|nr:ribosomal protein L16 [Bangia fuscopurpurea]AKA66477.1 ribosomal protein L16 [Bangia fuscopurpurea]
MKRFNTKTNPTRQHRQIRKSINQISHNLKRGQFGLRSLSYGRLNTSQVDNLRKILNKELKSIEKKSVLGKFKLWFYMLPNKAVTRFSPETRMGKGKGAIIDYCFHVRPGQLLFEIANFPEEKAPELALYLRNFLSLKVQILVKSNQIQR